MMQHREEESIIAQCTPQGSGAIALLRLCGADSWNIAQKMIYLAQGKRLQEQASHTVHAATVRAKDGTVIDHVMVIAMRGPRTFTGQDTIEITCHNNQFLVDAIIQEALSLGARIAEQGEFTRRAFLNKKIDLIQAEAINDLIHAQTQLALKKSLAQLEGSFSAWLAELEKELVRSLAWCEASFEFLDEEVEFGSQILAHITQISDKLADLKKTYDSQQQVRQGIRIALVGSVNAGKSSLFNTLLGQKRAIVTPIAGTTRDSIEASLYRHGNFWTLIDTAGMRKTDDAIEQEGILRSYHEAHAADIVILVIDGSRAVLAEELEIYQKLCAAHEHKMIIVVHKSDQPPVANINLPTHLRRLSLSSKDQKNHPLLEEAIEQKITALFEKLDSPFLLNKRQYATLLTLESKLCIISTMLKGKIQYELVSYHLKDALEDLSQLTGKSVSEAGMDMVFKEFCVGK